MSDASVEIAVPKETDGGVEIAVEGAPASKTAPIVSAEDGIKSLQQQVEQAKRDSADRLAAKDRAIADAFKRAQEAERETASVKLDQVGTIIDSLNKDQAAAKRDYRQAMEAGDFDKAADAQERMAISAARIVAAERGKMALADEVKNPPRQQTSSDDDPVEAVARSMTSTRSANWIRNHPDMVASGTISPLALAGHNLAVYNGHAPDSDAYFTYIENFVKNSGQTSSPRQDRHERQDGNGRNMNASVSAPVGRSAPQSSPESGGGRISFTKGDVDYVMEQYAPLFPKENRDQLLMRFHRDREALRAEGKIGRAS